MASHDISYEYDLNGNRTRMVDNLTGEVTTYNYDARNQLQAMVDSGGTTTFTYDVNGNRVRKETPALITDYRWDAKNHLIEIDTANDEIHLTYNADGQRIKKESGAGTVSYLYDFNHLLREMDGDDLTQKLYTFADDEWGDLVSEYSEEDGSLYHQYDAQWSTQALLDEVQSVTDRYKYRAFGLQDHTSGTSKAPHSFVGKQGYYRDSELDLYMLGMGNHQGGGRFYDPELGRFISQDPLRYDASDENLYRYVKNNPINAIDPSGREWLTWLSVLAVTGATSVECPEDATDENSARSPVATGDSRNGKIGLSGEPNAKMNDDGTITAWGKTFRHGPVVAEYIKLPDGYVVWYVKYRGSYYTSKTHITFTVPEHLQTVKERSLVAPRIPAPEGMSALEIPPDPVTRTVLVFTKEALVEMPESQIEALGLAGGKIKLSEKEYKRLMGVVNFVSPFIDMQALQLDLAKGYDLFEALDRQKMQIALAISLSIFAVIGLDKLAKKLAKLRKARKAAKSVEEYKRIDDEIAKVQAEAREEVAKAAKNNPEARKALQDEVARLRKQAEKADPDAKKLYNELADDLDETLTTATKGKGVTNPDVPKLQIDDSYFPSGVTNNRQFGKQVMKWGEGPEGAKTAIQNLTKQQLVDGGVTKEIALKWQQFYANEFARNSNNLTAKFREELMRKAIDLLQ